MMKSRFPTSIKSGQQIKVFASGEWSEGFFTGITKGVGRRQFYFNFKTLEGTETRFDLYRVDIVRKVTG